jgi:hypothetical protein
VNRDLFARPLVDVMPPPHRCSHFAIFDSIKNSLNPEWNKVFVFDYELGTPTKVAVMLFDEVQKGDNKSMGSAIFEIGELLGARGGTKAKKVRGGGT